MSFGQLTPSKLDEFVDDLPLLLVDRSKFYGERPISSRSLDESIAEDVSEETQFELTDEETDSTLNSKAIGAEDKFTHGQLAMRIVIVYFIYAQSKRLIDRGLEPMPEVPFNGKKAEKVTGAILPTVIRRIPPLPDEVALPLLAAAIKWVEHISEDVIVLQRRYLRVRHRCQTENLQPPVQLQKCNEIICRFRFRCLPGEGNPWREAISWETAENPVWGGVKLAPTQVLRNLIFFTREAAALLLWFLVGIRTSEICSLEGSAQDNTNLPPCVLSRPSKSGLLEIFYLKGLVSKGRKKPEQHEWVLGSRPYGAAWEPLPVKAIRVLQRLFQPWREFSGQTRLVLTFTQAKSLPWTKSTVKPIRASRLLRGTKHFMYSEVDLSNLPDTSLRGENLKQYRDSSGLFIRPQQGRKTFAAYILDTRRSLLPAVSDHFAHFDEEVTERAYYPSHAKQRNEFDSVLFSETVAFFVEAVRGRKIAGKMAESIKDYFSGSEFTEAPNLADLEHRVARIVVAHDLRIFFADHGKCCIRANPKASLCRKATNAASWNTITPDFAARSPGMCAGCGCFAIDSDHLPFWQNRLASQIVFYEQAKERGYEREYRVHLARAEQARNFLKYLQGEVV
ncbi:hypothetical protein [Paraburkholderia phytofirmans]|uniref:hypothetical protein n=1 Tax=Paraburkholderia phytofirmans TaxID=261302 RepID=UPI0038BB153B